MSDNSSSVAPPHTTPIPPAHFIGRTAEIAKIERALTQPESTTAGPICCVYGPGGVGKTALAVVVAARLAKHFPDGQIFLNLAGATTQPLDPRQAFVQLLHALGQAPTEQATLDELKGLYHTWLSNKHILLVADDARDAAQIESMQPQGWGLLITSRQRPRLAAPHNTLELEPLPESQATTLVRRICRKLTEEEARQLARLAGRQPLTLYISATLLDTLMHLFDRQMLDYVIQGGRRPDGGISLGSSFRSALRATELAKSERPIRRYLTSLAEERYWLRERGATGPAPELAAVFNLSYATLSPAAQELLRRLSIVAISIDQHIARHLVGPYLSLLASVDELLSQLVGAGLLERHGTRLSLHHAIRAQITDSMSKESLIRLRHAYHYLGIASTTHRFLQQDGHLIEQGLALFDTERRQIGTAWQWICGAAQHSMLDEMIIDYVTATAQIKEQRYDLRREYIPQQEAALAAAQRLERRPQEAIALGLLGFSYKCLGETEQAIQYLLQQIEVASEIGDQQLESTANGILGDAYRDAGDLHRATTFYDRHLLLARQLNNQLSQMNALANLGNTHLDLNDFPRAVVFYKQARELAHAIGEPGRECHVLYKLGQAYSALAELQDAIIVYRQALSIAHLMDDRHIKSLILSDLGNVCISTGDWMHAVLCFDRQRALAEELGDRTGAGYALSNIGATHALAGNFSGGVQYLEQALAIFRETDDRRGETAVFGGLGTIYRQLEDYPQAIACCEQRLALARDLEDSEHELAALSHLAYLYNDLEDDDQVIQYCRQALEHADSAGDQSNEIQLQLLLGNKLAGRGQYSEAIPLLQAGVEFKRAIQQSDADQVAAVVEELRQRLADQARVTDNFVQIPALTYTSVVGRDPEIARLTQALMQHNTASATVACVYGRGGLGKTTLATVVASRLSAGFSDQHILVKLGGSSAQPYSPQQALEQVLHGYGQTLPPQATLAEITEVYRTLLSSKHALIIADDAYDTAQIEALLPPPGSVLLITSRRELELAVPHVMLTLDDLPDDDARIWVQTMYPQLTTEQAAQLVAACDGLPLAVRIGAMLLRHITLPVDEYLANLATTYEHLQMRSDQSDYTGLEAVLRLNEQVLPLPANLMLIYLAICTNPVTRSKIVQATVAMVASEESLHHIIEILEAAGLLVYATEIRSYTLQHLVRQLMFPKLGRAVVVHLRHTFHYLRSAGEAEQLFQRDGQRVEQALAQFDLEQPQIDAAREWLRQQPGTGVFDHMLLWVMDATQHIGDVRYHQREHIPWLEQALATALRIKNTSIEHSIRTNLGTIYLRLGDHRRATEYHKQALAISQASDDRESKALTLSNLGSVYLSLSDYPRAIEHYQQHLSLAQANGYEASTGLALDGLGNTYVRMGDYPRAIEYYMQSLALSRSLGDRRSEQSTLSNLGLAYDGLGSYQRAIDYFEQALATSRALKDRRSMAHDLGHLAVGSIRLGDYQTGIDYAQQCLTLAREIEEPHAESGALNCLGGVYLKLSAYPHAMEYWEQALVVSRKLGNRHDEGMILGNLGIVQLRLGNTRQAIELHEQALSIAQSVQDASGEARALGNLGLDYGVIGNFNQSIAYHKQHLALARRLTRLLSLWV